MGFDFSILPGGGGETGIAVTSLDLVIETAQCIGTEVIDVVACMRAIVDIFSLLFDLFFGDIFAGRPKVGKDSASDDTALFFIASSNPVIKMWGMGIRGLEGKGIPTSVSGGWGLSASINLADAVLADLRRQFDGPTAPRLFLHNVYGTAPVTGLNLFSWYHRLGFQEHNPDSNGPVIAERQIIDNFYNLLVRDGYIDPKTGFPHQPGGGPPPPPPPPPPNPKIPPPPTSPPSNYDNAELCCWYEEQYQYHLAAGVDQIATLLAQQGANTECCTQVVAVLLQIFQGLASVVTSIGSGADAIANSNDNTPLVDVIGQKGNELAGALQQLFNMLGSIHQDLEHIASAEASEKPVDLKPLVDALNEANKLQDVPKEVIDQLVSEGYMTPAMAQVVGGSAHVKIAAGVYKFSPVTWADRIDAWWKGKAPPTYPEIKPFSTSARETFADAFKVAFETSKTLFAPVVDGILKAHNDEISKLRDVGPCQESAGASALLTEAIGAAVGAHLAAMGVEVLYPTKHLGFEKIVDIIAAIAGVEDIIGGLIGVEIQQLITIPHRYCINALGRTILPSLSQAGDLHARGLITPAQAAQLSGWNGIHREYENTLLTAAYSGLNPRQLLRLSATGLFDEHDLADEMTFAGLRAASQHRMLIAAPYLATDPERKQLRAALEKGYVEGFIAEQDLVQQLDDAEHNTSRTFLVLDRVRLEKRMALAKELELEYTTLYLGNQINLDTYHANLVGLGLQDDRVRALTARNEARAAVTLARQEAAAARALARATAAEERKAAMRNYLQGNINAIALAAALELTGLTHAQTAAWVDIAALELAGKPRFAFGLRLTPDKAQLLTDRVRALNDQRKRQLIKDVEYAGLLKQLGIPPIYINALRAAADATLTPAKSALVLPVETGA